MKRLHFIAAPVAALLLPGQAQACTSADSHAAIVHNALPRPLPRGTIIADVVFDPADTARIVDGIRVRVRRMIQGDYRRPTMIVRQRVLSSCSGPFANGTAGLIVAIPVETQAGELVVAPIEVSRGSGFRLPDGFQLADPRPGDVRLRLR